MIRDTFLRRVCILLLGVPVNEIQTICDCLEEHEEFWQLAGCHFGQIRPSKNELACCYVLRDWIYQTHPKRNWWLLIEVGLIGILLVVIFWPSICF